MNGAVVSLFNYCLGHVLRAEGGFVNHPKDKGGPTNFGITLFTFRSFYSNQELQVEDLKKMSASDAGEIYRTLYWTPMRLEEIKKLKLCLVLFDQCVNRGVVQATKLLQRTLNAHFHQALKEDGLMGPRTVNAAIYADEDDLVRRFIQECQMSYIDICLKNPDQLVFLKGWMNRTYLLQEAIA